MLPRIINEGCMKPFQSSLVALITFGLLPFGVAAPEATPASKLSVLNGFKVELLYSPDKPTEGSWVAMAIDPKGRLIV